MQAEIVTIGTELLLGQIIDTNAAYISQQLAAVGVNVFYRTNVGDNVERAAQVLREALDRSEIVITTGGLGPTADDVTREAVARASDRELILHEVLLKQIEAMFTRWGRPMSSSNRVQAMAPAGCIPIENPVGTAPGFIVEKNYHIMLSLPGVPREMTYLMDKTVMPYLRQRFGLRGAIKSKMLRVSGMGESVLGERIDDLMRESNPSVGTMAHTGQVDVRIAAKAESEDEADAMIAAMEVRVRERLGEFIFGTDKDTLEGVTAWKLKQSGATLALVETNTGGVIAQRLTGAPHGIGTLKSAWIITDPQWAAKSLGLDGHALASAEAAQATAEWAHRTSGATWGMGVMGTFGADEHLYGQRTGEVWIALTGPRALKPERFPYGGVSEQSRTWIANRALDLLRRNV
ncbi:MAG: CinA family nicotinamide mononucleotide deamidase-related protein [Chloroflexi bacterium]|nr:CinA family nicotinamide mononucleotide deamidase-related protein [Chloroflexota bacterium]MBI3732208.1 CinA family nicotinamide mononucleotide deamidase-related protein [Chloroflexota bacterium]